MKSLIRSSESLDSKIKECLEALEEHKEELDILYRTKTINMDEYLEILEESGKLTSNLIMQMRIIHDYR